MIKGVLLAASVSLSMILAPASVHAASDLAEAEPAAAQHFIHQFMEMNEYGDEEGLKKIMESVALVLTAHAQEKGLTQEEFNEFTPEEVDSFIEEVFVGAEAWTLADLHEKARPMREFAEQEIESRALDSKDTLLERKAEIERFNDLERTISIGQMQRGSDIDEFGYPRWFIQAEVQNDAENVLTHIELGVIVTGDPVGKGTVFLRADNEVQPGTTAVMKAYVDPTSLLGEAFPRAAANEIGHQVRAFYLEGAGRVFKWEWTDDMEDMLNLALEVEHRKSEER